MGFPVDYEMGRAMSKYQEVRRKHVHEAVRNLVVKVICLDSGNNCVGFFNGFFYHDTEPLLITSGHIVEWNGATEYAAVFYQGTASEERVSLGKPIKVGAAAGMKNTPQGVAYMAREPDVAVFRISQQPPHPHRVAAAVAAVGDDVYSVGFKGVSEAALVFSEGIVTSLGLAGMSISAYADEGFSGAPVFNGDGRLVGMVQGINGDSTRTLQVNTVPSLTIHNFLKHVTPELPGLE